MSKLLFKESTLENVVIRSLDSSLEHLNNANRQIYSISIPDSFNESQNLKDCLNDVQAVKRKVENLKQWAIHSSQKFENVLQDMSGESLLLPKTQLQVRNTVVR